MEVVERVKWTGVGTTEATENNMGEEKDVYSTVKYASNYKLVPLTGELVAAMKKKEKLTIKASSDTERDLVITSADQTFQVRQKNHSNTQLLTRNFEHGVLCTASFSNELELKVVDGHLEVGGLAIYDGDFEKFTRAHASGSNPVERVLAQSSVSEKEFYAKWTAVCGCEVDRNAVLLGQEFVTELLSLIINTLIASDLDPNADLDLAHLYELVSQNDDSMVITVEMVHAVLVKFSKDASFNDLTFRLDLGHVSTWYGIHSLKNLANRANLQLDEFLINWRSTLPSALSVNLDLSNLKGHYYTPAPGLIRYINRQTLPSDPVSRFKNLFLLQQQWLIDEIEPFVADLNVKNLKPASFVMKYARVKKQGSKTIVIGR